MTGRRDGVVPENKVRRHYMNVDGREGGEGEGVIPSRCSCKSSGNSVFQKQRSNRRERLLPTVREDESPKSTSRDQKF